MLVDIQFEHAPLSNGPLRFHLAFVLVFAVGGIVLAAARDATKVGPLFILGVVTATVVFLIVVAVAVLLMVTHHLSPFHGF